MVHAEMNSQTEADAQRPSAASAAYTERLEALRATEQRLEREHTGLGYVRLAFGIAVPILLLPPRPAVVLPVLGFALAARIHQRVLGQLAETRRALAFYQHGQARLEHRWAGLRPRSTRLDTTASLYAADLDLFGPASLFEYLCEARTSLGEDVLAGWLLAPATAWEVTRRQEAVAELRPMLPLREAFAAARGPAVASVDRNALAGWGNDAGVPIPEALRWVAPLLVALTLAAAARFAFSGNSLLLVLALLIDVSLTFAYRQSFRTIFAEAEHASRALYTVGALLQLIETAEFTSEPLQRGRTTLQAADRPASDALTSLARLMTWAEARSNYIVRILDGPFLYSLQLALAVGTWRKRFGSHLAAYLDALSEVEVLLSLAGYSFEHPADVFPVLVEGEPTFSATGLGHPLLPEAECVRNDVSLGDGTKLLLVSGSNMSGKSTLMRSVGINTVLALAGAPVRAQTLRLSQVTVAASIQVSDSLQAGRSRFYAEILRLRAITEAARHPGHVLFLIDEVLAGTNSSDRAAGARGLVRELLRSGAVGLLSTHDLALTAIGAELQEQIRNVHFEDEIVEGRLHFTYKLQEGVVQRSNGLDLMRLIGLDV